MKNRLCINCLKNLQEVMFKEKLNVLDIGTVEIGTSLCKECGSVFQNPVVPEEFMKKYYEEFSNYTNVQTNFVPSNEIKELIEKQVSFCLKNISKNFDQEKKLFQIGYSNGYTLSVFKKFGWDVTGIDPSSRCASVAKNQFDIKIFTGFFENFEPKINSRYSLIVMTHVLEHIYKPKEVLLKCRNFLKEDGYLFVEVPVLENEELLPNGYFTFEHLQYFSEKILKNILHNCGFQVLSTRRFHHQYPVISVVCKKINIPTTESKINDYEYAHTITEKFLSRQKKIWENISKKINENINSKNRVYVWGAGIHTSKLFAWTKIDSKYNILGIIDSDPQKHGRKLQKLTILDPKEVVVKDQDVIIISSYASENQIFEYLKSTYKDKIKIIKLYN